MATTWTVSDARAALPEILERVLEGEEITLTKYGRPVAVVVRPDTLRARRSDDALASASAVRESLAEGSNRPLAEHGTVSVRRAEELIAEIRAGRSAR